MSKRFISIFMAIILVLGLGMPTLAAEEIVFNDIGESPYNQAIMELHTKGVISSNPNNKFYPERILTKAEAAALLVRGFKLSEIEPLMVENTELEKKFSYSNPLEVITDAFSIPSSKDIVNHWGMNYIEGLLKVRADKVVGNEYKPNDTLTKTEFIEMIAKVVFGVDKEIDFIQEIVDLDLVSKEFATSDELINREEAAYVLHNILSNPSFKVITVFATSDIHGHLEPYKATGMEREIGGLSKMSKIIKDFRKKQPNTLLIDGGDAPYNTNIANLFEGASTIEVMNEMGYDAMALGNHDFDFPFEVMKRNAGNAKFPFLSANTYFEEKYPEFLKPSIIKEVDGIKVGIIGITDDMSHVYTHPNNVKGITFKEQFEATQNAIDAIKDETDIIITLAHIHGNNPILPTKVKGIDIEIGGGQDVVGFPQDIEGTWLISPGKHAEVLNQININVLDNKMIGLNFAHIFLTENLENDPVAESIIGKYKTQLDEKMKEVVGESTVVLDGERGTARMKESNLANLIADSLLDITGADIALQNGGGVRASIAQGPITMNDVYAVLPFDNTVVVVEATGETIWKTLEHGVSWYPGAAGGFLQVAGLKYTFDASKEVGSRVTEVLVDDKPIEMDKVYKVVSNDFLTGGGDNFTMLKDETTETLKTKLYLRDVFVEYLMKVKTVSPELEGRITVINPAE